jgi:hypothetical protein
VANVKNTASKETTMDLRVVPPQGLTDFMKSIVLSDCAGVTTNRSHFHSRDVGLSLRHAFLAPAPLQQASSRVL